MTTLEGCPGVGLVTFTGIVSFTCRIYNGRASKRPKPNCSTWASVRLLAPADTLAGRE